MRKGRKAAGLVMKNKMAELPKDEPLARSAFFIFSHERGMQPIQHCTRVMHKRVSAGKDPTIAPGTEDSLGIINWITLQDQ